MCLFNANKAYKPCPFYIKMEEESKENAKQVSKIGQEQIHGLLFEEKLSWQAIIYDLIRTEQLDPWDVNLGYLANKYLDKVKQLEEANFFISSQVLLAASLLLRLKSDILLDEYIPGLDAVLFGKKKEEKKHIQERLELGEEIPELVLRSPLPRYKKVTLDELMTALGQAINTENRRIRKVVISKQQELETAIALPKHRINIKERIHELFLKLKSIFSVKQEKVPFSKLSGKTREEKIATFVPLLHLDNQQKVWLEQGNHFDEIWILLKSIYEKQNAEILLNLKNEAEQAIEKLVEEEKSMKKSSEKNKKGKDDEEESDEKEESEELSAFSNPVESAIEEISEDYKE